MAGCQPCRGCRKRVPGAVCGRSGECPCYGPVMRERDTVYCWWLSVCSLACASAPAAPAVEPSSPLQDAKAVMAQELGEQPAAEGPCPERSVPRVLENPRAP